LNYENAKSKPELIIKGEKYRITILSEILLRLEYDENGIFEDRPTELAIFRNFNLPEFEIKQDDKYLMIKTKYYQLEYTKEKPFIGSKATPDKDFRVKLLGSDKLWFFNHPEARNLNGSAASLDNISDKIPFKKGLYSLDGFVSIDDSTSLLIDEEGMLKKREDKRIDTYLFMYRRDFGFCLRDYFKLTGHPPLIPRYSLGIWWHKKQKYRDYDLKELVGDFKDNDIPLSVLLLDSDWNKKSDNLGKTGFTFNESLFPNPVEFTNYMHERGIHVGLNIDPKDGILPHEEHYDDFVSGLNLGEKVIIPFNPFDKYLIINYLKALIEPLNGYGVDFYWLDYKENLENLRALNYYHTQDFNKNSNRRPLIFSRNPLVASHRYPAHYSGETQISWKTLEMLPLFNSTASNIGLSWWSHDIGGFKDGIEDKELYLRYVQLGCFSPIFRFASNTGRYYKRQPWLWNIKINAIASFYCNLRHRLIPYIYTEAHRYSSMSLPLIQPLYYQYPEIYDEPAYKNQYYFGSQFLVAPIISKMDDILNRSVQKVYLPAGTWYDFKTGKKFQGDKRFVLFYKDEDYPLFVRPGAIIPLANLEDNFNNTSAPKSMEVHIFPGKTNSYTLYEDDGITSLYKDGQYIKTEIKYEYSHSNFTVNITPIEGKGGIIPNNRDYRIRIRNCSGSKYVTAFVDKNTTPVFAYEENNDLVVEIKDVPTYKSLTINCQGKDIEIDATKLINDDIHAIISDLQIATHIKEKIDSIFFSDLTFAKKRIEVRKLKKIGLNTNFIRMLLKLLDYLSEF